ncbi:MAG TPA: DoxX family protein [Pyrinomonadaceae bacterium]
MQLLFLLLLLVGPYALLTIAGRRFGSLRSSPSVKAGVGLSLFFAFTALGHFVRTEEMAEMLPPAVPYRVELIYLTGVFELLGAAGVWVPRLRRLTGVCLIVMLLCVLPANVYAALNRVGFGGHEAGPAYLLVRVPFQLLVAWWVYLAAVRPPRQRFRGRA